ncbi:unnamed protein product [Vitrella brassicaformis CCMP3155]|uniref:RING-type domain-containing protein n=1 Tax=Vitrella brassicaformis (strain CCMP3155) TaxID=1169540 RepID=A0A0G4GIE7_VITBC|nr:unnamed protein product [Vitrella brassicaformis CCMP3155]|eukprot:CEM29618.1 unnamed protein product [Vitrella brassicaformis CCMP3155]
MMAPQRPDVFPSLSSVDRPLCHRGPPPLVSCPRSSKPSLSQDEGRFYQSEDAAHLAPFYEQSSSYDVFPSSSSYDYHPSEPAPSSPTPPPPPPASAPSAAPSQPLDQSYEWGYPFSGPFDDSSQYHRTEAEPYEPEWPSWADEDIPDSEVPLPGPIFEDEEVDQPQPHSADSYAAAAAAAATGGGGADDSMGVSSREAELQRQNDELARQLEETQRRLAELSVQQQPHSSQPPSSSSSAAPPPLPSPPQVAGIGADGDLPPGECVICFGEHGVASIMYVPCKHLCVCGHCYADRRRRHEARVRRHNARAESEADKRSIPKFECDICRKEVDYAGTRAEVLQWIGQPFT